VNVAGQYIFGVGQHSPGVVSQDDLYLGTALADELGIVVQIVHTGKGVEDFSEQGAELLQGEDILIWVNTLFVKQVDVHQMVAHLIGGVA